MKQIDEYLDDLYKGDTSKETMELKSEMKAHLLESVKELQYEGYREEEAVKMAIDRFDGGLEMENELHGIIKKNWFENSNIKNKFTKLFRSITIVSIILYGVISIYSYKMENYHHSLLNNINKDLNITIGKKDISNQNLYKNELDSLLRDKYSEVRELSIYTNGEEKYEHKGDLAYNYTKSKSGNTLFLENENNNKLNNDGEASYKLGIDAGLYLIADNLVLINLFIGLGGFIGYILSKLNLLDELYEKLAFKLCYT